AGVGAEVVKLAAAGFEGVDELPVVRGDEGPLVGVLAIVGFGDDILRSGCALDGGNKARPAHLVFGGGGHLDIEQIENGRHQVEAAMAVANDGPSLLPREPNQ